MDTRTSAQPGARLDLALVITDLNPGGAQRVLTTLANAWAKEGRRISIITLGGDELSFFPLDERVERQPLGLAAESRSLVGACAANARRLLALRRAIRRSGTSVVVSFVGATNVLSVLAVWGLGARLVICERNDPSKQSLGRPWDWLRRRLYRYADVVTANSRSAHDWLRRYVPADRLRYLPNPLAMYSSQLAPTEGARILLAVGRLSRQKGYDVLLEAFARTRARAEGWRLLIVGDGELREALCTQARHLGIDDQIDWRGHSNDVVADYLKADIFVMASRHEGMPNVVLEAMALGRPVIITDGCGGVLDVVSDGKTGLVVPVEDAAALGAATDRMAADSHLRRRLAEAARESVQAFRLDRVLPLWDEVTRQAETAAAAKPDAKGMALKHSLPQDGAR